MALGTAASIGLAAGGALLGGISGSKPKGGGTTTQTSTPWEPAQPFITNGLGAAGVALQNALANPVYQGNRVASLTPAQTQAMGYANDYVNTGFSNAYNAQRVGSELMGTGAQFGNNAANLFNQYSVDPTQTIIGNAGQYANNPYIDGMIDASARDVTRNLYENQLPTLAKAAAGSGNTNSTRAGVENAIAMRGAGDRLADMSNTIRGQFFGKGLDMSQNQYNQNLTNSLNVNNQLSNAYTQGLGGMNTGMNLATNAFGLGMNAGNVEQRQNQREIDSEMAKFAEERGVPLDILKQYMSIVGQNFGGTQTSTTPSSGGGLMGGIQGALGGALGGYGLAGGSFSNFGNNVQSAFSQTPLGSSGFGTGLAYGNQDIGTFL